MKNAIKMLLLIGCTILLCNSVQSQDWQWSHQVGSDSFDGAIGTSDKSGNFYIGGTFEGYNCIFLNQTLHKNGANGFFLAKYNSNGNEEWVKQFDGMGYPSDSYNAISDVIIDDQGYIYITGIFYNIAIFDTITLTSDLGDVFVAKFSSTGNCLWAKKCGGPGNDSGTGLAVDNSGNVFVVGSNSETAYFDSLLVDPGTFLANFDSNGFCQWVKNIASFNSQTQLPMVYFYCLLIVGNNLYAQGTENFSMFQIDTIHIDHPGLGGSILCSFNHSGSIQWAREGISPIAYAGENMSTDTSGNILCCGIFYDSINFAGNILHSDPNYSYYFVSKYASTGNLVWTQRIKNEPTMPTICSLQSDELGGFYFTGSFNGISAFGPDTITSLTNRDMFLARYSQDGTCFGALNFGEAQGQGIGFDDTGNPIIVGLFKGDISIGNNSFSSYSNSEDIFIAKCGQINGVDEKKAKFENQLLIYANPNAGKCSITMPEDFRHEEHLTLSIYNNQGKLIQQSPVEIIGDRVSLNISAEAKGMYTAVLTNGKKNYTGKIVFK